MKRSADDRDLRKLPSAADAKPVFMSKAERQRREEVVAEHRRAALDLLRSPPTPAADATTPGLWSSRPKPWARAG